MYSCNQLVPKGHLLLAVIKPYVSDSHMYVLFVYKVKRFNNAKVIIIDKYN